MKNIIIGLMIGLLLNGLIVFAKENVTAYSFQNIKFNKSGYNPSVYTTKVVTPEGAYRIFISKQGYAGGITAIKIK